MRISERIRPDASSRRCCGEQVANGAGVELLADHGGALDRAALVVGQAFETSGEQRRHRGRNRDRAEIARREPGPVLPDQHPVVDQHREHLLDEERVAAGRLGQSVRRLGRQTRAAEQVRDQLRRRLRVEGLEQQRRGVHLAAAPVRARVEELRASGAHEHDRGVARPVDDVIHDVEERRFGPVDVLPDRDQWPFGGEDLEEPPDRPRRFLGAPDALADAQDLAEAMGDRCGMLVTGDHAIQSGGDVVGGVEHLHAECRTDRLGHRPVRDPLAVREASAGHDPRALARRGEELLDQARLALARSAEHGEQETAPILRGAGERAREVLELALPADHPGKEGAPGLSDPRDDLEQPEGGHGLGLALEREPLDRFRDDRVAHQAMGLVADQDLIRLGGGLQAGGGVHRVAGDAAEVRGLGADEHLAGVHADPAGEADGVVAFELVVEVLECGAHVDGGADRAERVVLVELRDAEHGHDGVPDELLDRAPVAFERRAHRVEVAEPSPCASTRGRAARRARSSRSRRRTRS